MKEKPGSNQRSSKWNPSLGVWPCVHELIEQQTQRTPDVIALEFESLSLTYAELDARAAHLAGLLKSLGAGPEVLVGLYADRSLALVVGILGILKAGAAYVPLDAALPRARRDFILADSAARILVTTEATETSGSAVDLIVVNLDKEGNKPKLNAASQKPLKVCGSVVRPENLAYIMYTSGSTGRPKGVEVTHGSIVNVLDSFTVEPGLSAADTLVAVTTHSFDISVLELLWPLSVGAKVIIANRLTRGRGDKLVELLRGSKANVMQATPATWYMLIEAGWKPGKDFLALCGGEPLPVDLAKSLLELGCQLWNLYGPTETTIWSTIHPVRQIKYPVPVGRPILNTTIEILDGTDDFVANGELGEIIIGGVGVARGYHNHAEFTKERFLVRKDAKGRPQRFFRTGDFGRRLPDGSIEFVGRADRQVKLQGFRIELGEIEAVLCEHPAVLKSAVIVQGDGVDKRLVGYIVARQNQQVRTKEIIEIMRRRLPPYMFVQKLFVVPDLPLTANGKVDRRSLAAVHEKKPTAEKAARKLPYLLDCSSYINGAIRP